MKKEFKMDIAFTRVIREWFLDLNLSFVVIGLSDEVDIKPEALLQRKFFEDDVLCEFPAFLTQTGNIRPVFKTSIVFKEDHKTQAFEKVFKVKYHPRLLFLIKQITPNGNTYYSFSKLHENLDKKMVLNINTEEFKNG